MDGELTLEAIDRIWAELSRPGPQAPIVWPDPEPAPEARAAARPTSGSPGGWGFVMTNDHPVRVTDLDTVMVSADGRSFVTSGSAFIYMDPTPFDEATRLEWESQRRDAEEKYRRDQEAFRKANERSLALLSEFMTASQRDQYREAPEFIAVSKSGRRYKIRPGQQVLEIDAVGDAIFSYCIAPNAALPHGDVMLAQKLMLETNEDKFHQIANRFRVTTCVPGRMA